jgi:TRAP-type C4-dicarboxylate transport system substrate-binding protein
VIFNAESWDALSPESQDLISKVVIEWEEKSYNDRQADVVADAAELKKRGMEFVPLSADASAKYLKLADDAAWGRMKGRLDDAGDTTTYDALRKLYHP